MYDHAQVDENVGHCTFTNWQRAILLRHDLAVLDLLSSLKTLITQHFIGEYPAPLAAARLGRDKFEKFLKRHRFFVLTMIKKSDILIP